MDLMGDQIVISMTRKTAFTMRMYFQKSNYEP